MAIARELISPFEEDEDLTQYPVEDGEPMAESPLHWRQTVYCALALETWFADRPKVLVASDNFIYYERGNRSAVVSPDCYVVFGVDKRLRDSYFVWREGGHTPNVVIEITSKSTRAEDEGDKKQKYARLAVEEYYQFDPTGDYLNPILKGSRLVNGQYVPIPLGEDRIYSPLLELDLVIVGQTLRYIDPTTGTQLPTYEEQEAQLLLASQARAEAEHRAESEALARAEAEARIAQLTAELQALRQKP
ncbi:MAG TPA: Uma2 family endonuclease [Chthonomonadaceae bacterium]|nr:Uma2 family endonuclease [Chthonomonadaceae bacterium]